MNLKEPYKKETPLLFGLLRKNSLKMVDPTFTLTGEEYRYYLF